MPPKKASQPKLSFAEARTRLDEILNELEREAGDVDQLAARIKEASELIRMCRERLSAARQEVREVVAELTAQPDAQPAGADDEPLPEPPGETVDEHEGSEGSEGGQLPF